MRVTQRAGSMGTIKFMILLILYCVCVTFEYPSRPLNERSPDLTWQAWLLVDDQNQNQNKQTNADGMLRRRITPKSVFIAPTFSPESLPACADGYSSDPMGRCIKIIKLDQDAHYEFLIEKLKQKFESFDYEEEEEEEEEETVMQPTAGPFQVNIPLNIDGVDLNPEESDQETDVAIIVSPTKPNFDFKIGNLGKRDSVADEIQQEMLLRKLVETTRNYPEVTTTTILSTTLENDNKFTMPVNQEPTTITELFPAEDTEITTTNEATESTKDNKITTEITETTTEGLSTLTTSELKYVTQSPKPLENDAETEYEFQSHTSQITTISPKPEVATTNNFVHFPNQLKAQTLLNSYVRFPHDSESSYQTQVPSSIEHITNTRDASVYRKKTDRPIVFPEQDVVSVDYSNGAPNPISQVDLNRRNRDRHNSLFLIPPRRNPSSFQKPLVLRFSRKHAFMDSNQFKNPDYYRSIPSDDFAYLFKYKHRQQLHRR